MSVCKNEHFSKEFLNLICSTMKMMHVTNSFREASHVLHIPRGLMLLYQYYAVSFLYKTLFWEERYTGL